jgi:uncharacterized coiled-coil DUF342 family protein
MDNISQNLNANWYNIEDEAEKREKESYNEKLTILSNEIDNIKKEINFLKAPVLQTLSEINFLKSELLQAQQVNIKLREELLYTKGLNEREKNQRVRLGIPFRFSPDHSTYNRL